MRRIGRSFLLWQRAFAARHSFPLKGRLRRLAVLGGFVAVMAGAAAVAIVAAPRLTATAPSVRTVVEPAVLPDLLPLIAAAASDAPVETRHAVLGKSETLLSVLARLGIRDPEARAFIESTPGTRPLLTPAAGQFVTAGVLEDGRLAFLRLHIAGADDTARRVEVVREGHVFRATNAPFLYTTEHTLASGSFKKSLAATLAALKVPADVAEQLEEVWIGADNPIKSLREGDSLRLVYERRFADGEFVRNGRLLAVQTVRGDAVREAFWYAGAGSGGYYTIEGRSASQTFMRVPLDVQDVSSEFAPLRRHPVTGVLRAHNGTDLRAPSGSRIFAAADGVVTRVAYEAKGYGRYVAIDHGLGRTTLYAHMSRVERGLKKGRRVEKGQVIGYVGMTGLATGPHLHYELMLDGVQINPKTADLPDTENLSPYQTAQLRAAAAPLLERFEEAAAAEKRPSPEALKLAAAEKAAEASRLEAERDAALEARGEDEAGRVNESGDAKDLPEKTK